MVISKQISQLGLVEYYVLGLHDLKFFDVLKMFIQQQFQARLMNQDKGLFTQKAYFNIDGIDLILEHHDDIGNYFYSTHSNATELLEKISSELEQRLNDCPYE